jgi:hypothetical protein
MGTPLYMELDDACRIVKEYAELYCEGDISEGVKSMEECYDDLEKEERVAYRMFVAADQARKIFDTEETA